MSQIIHCQNCGRYSNVSPNVHAQCPTCGGLRVRVVSELTSAPAASAIVTIARKSELVTDDRSAPSARFHRVLKCLGIGLSLVVVGILITAYQSSRYGPEFGYYGDATWQVIGWLMVFGGLALSITAGILGLRIVWNAWSTLGRADADAIRSAGVISPGMAIGLLFVPLFNAFWVYRVFFNWARTAEQVMKRKFVVGKSPRHEPGQFFAVLVSLMPLGQLVALLGAATGEGWAVLLGLCLTSFLGLGAAIAYLLTLREMEQATICVEGTSVVPALAISA